MKSKIAFALLFPPLIFLLFAGNTNHLGDTDRYYHFALSRILAEAGAFSLQVLPQVVDIGWSDYFPDKEFLFHVLTRIGYSLGGEGGVSAVGLLVAAGAGIVLYTFALGYLPPAIAFLCAFSALFTHSLIFRMLVVRPHVLAIFFFLLLVFAILRRRLLLTAIAAGGYVLAYHAFYIPLACLGFVFIVALFEPAKERNAWWKLIGSGLAGLALGILLNPYFPSPLYMGVLHAKIPYLISGPMRGVPFGMELFPLGAPGMLKFYYFPFAILLLAARYYQRSFAFSFLFLLSIFFGALAFQTVRAGEYFIPAAGMLFALVLAGLKNKQPNQMKILAAGAAAVQLAMLLLMLRTEASYAPDAGLHEQTRQAIAAIPEGKAKVFNCEWDSGAFLLHQRPDLRFVELLDPSFLFAHDEELFREKEKFRKGEIADPFFLVRGIFLSDFVLCRSRGIVAQLDADPAFQRIFPATGAAEIYLFKVASKPPPAYVKDFSGRSFSVSSVEEARKFEPSAASELREAKLSAAMTGLQFEAPATRMGCSHVRASAPEIKRLAGARYLGAGGGQAMRVWRNGKLLYASGPGFSRARSVQSLMRLEPKLAANDKIDLLVCSGAAGGYSAVALSLWSEAELSAACEWKRAGRKGESRGSFLFTSDQESCIGTMAGSALPPEFL